MNMRGTYISLIIIGLFIAYLILSSLFEDNYIKNNGIEITVKIAVCQEEYLISGKRYGMTWLSSGYYYVNGKEYKCSFERIVPIGTEFKIKYNPKDPERWRPVNPHEFDNYPINPKKK